MNFDEDLKINPELDLILERVVDVPPELVWKAWTSPEHLVHWFCPKPWSVSKCEIDLKPGGAFLTTMCSPEGEEHPNVGCYLEVVENKKLVWTDALLPGFRPSALPVSGSSLFFTGKILIRPEGKDGKSTRYTAIALHRDSVDKHKHAEMGFHEGWGTCLEQLVAYVKEVKMK